MTEDKDLDEIKTSEPKKKGWIERGEDKYNEIQEDLKRRKTEGQLKQLAEEKNKEAGLKREYDLQKERASNRQLQEKTNAYRKEASAGGFMAGLFGGGRSAPPRTSAPRERYARRAPRRAERVRTYEPRREEGNFARSLFAGDTSGKPTGAAALMFQGNSGKPTGGAALLFQGNSKPQGAARFLFGKSDNKRPTGASLLGLSAPSASPRKKHSPQRFILMRAPKRRR